MTPPPLTIPRIIHQTWKTLDVPVQFRTFQASWRRHHPDWAYRYWTDAEIRTFIASAYPWFLPTFDGYTEQIRQVDAFRYFLLHRYGGVYADLDSECVQALDGLLAGHDVVLGCEPERHADSPAVSRRGLDRVLGNAVMASVPGHPFWLHVTALLNAARSESQVLDATGPFLLSRAYQSYPERERITVLGPEIFYPLDIWQARDDTLTLDEQRQRIGASAYAIHHWAGTWRRRQVLDTVRERLRARRQRPPGDGA